MFCMYEAGNPSCFGWMCESRRAFLDPHYSRTAVLVKEIFRLGVSMGFLGIPLASEILLLEHSSRAGQEAAGKEGNELFCSSCSPASPWLRGTITRMLALVSLLSQQALAQLRANMKSKPSSFVLEQVFITRSSPTRSKWLVLGAGMAYLT